MVCRNTLQPRRMPTSVWCFQCCSSLRLRVLVTHRGASGAAQSFPPPVCALGKQKMPSQTINMFGQQQPLADAQTTGSMQKTMQNDAIEEASAKANIITATYDTCFLSRKYSSFFNPTLRRSTTSSLSICRHTVLQWSAAAVVCQVGSRH